VAVAIYLLLPLLFMRCGFFSGGMPASSLICLIRLTRPPSHLRFFSVSMSISKSDVSAKCRAAQKDSFSTIF
jgi:hypothetical protein